MNLHHDDYARAEITAGAYENVPATIKAMTKQELAVIVSGLHCRVKIIQQEWGFRTSYCPTPASECPEITELFAALEDYKTLASLDDIQYQLGLRQQENGDMGCVYVAEFDDGCVKIGRSINPLARMRGIAGANQAKLLRSWATDRHAGYGKLEKAAHREFAAVRAGGEFFKASFDDVVAWIESVRKELP